jgi:hypothetical protein
MMILMKNIYIISVEFFSYIESKFTNSDFDKTENEKYFVNYIKLPPGLPFCVRLPV